MDNSINQEQFKEYQTKKWWDNYSSKKKLEFVVLKKGQIIDYQEVLEEVIGPQIGVLDCYDHNIESKRTIKGHRIESDRGYFVPEHDYVLSIKRKTRTKVTKTKEAKEINESLMTDIFNILNVKDDILWLVTKAEMLSALESLDLVIVNRKDHNQK